MNQLPVSRIILASVCGSYLLSAALLAWAKTHGQIVPAWKIGGWLLTGIIGLVLLIWLSPAEPIISFAMLIALAPWMAYALTEDARSGHYIIAVIDLAGLFAIAYALWIIRKTVGVH
jgi:hypothetical protein